jgi:hypothetical protein
MLIRRWASAPSSSPLLPFSSAPAFAPWLAAFAEAALAWPLEQACAVPDARSRVAFAAAGPVRDASPPGEPVLDGCSVPPPADGLAPDDSSQAGSRVVEFEVEAENDSAASPDDCWVAPRAHDSAAPERLPLDVHSLEAGLPAGSWVGSQVVRAGWAAPHWSEPDGLHSVSPVSPEAPPSPSAALPRWLPDAASALRFWPAAVRDALPEPVAVLQKALGAEVASSWQPLAGSRRRLEAPLRDLQ